MSKKIVASSKSFPETVQYALDKQERSQAWLARKCGITYAAMNRIMKGNHHDCYRIIITDGRF